MSGVLYAALPELLGGFGTGLLLALTNALVRLLRARFKRAPAAQSDGAAVP
ncbi:hypothetical protein [Streptomyces sp. NPDC088707]|uniref:hypothetical protein n=1 Tax=Streptomyces sp. NPDC088707 TaxID=3365871 RepID=UPI0037FBE123